MTPRQVVTEAEATNTRLGHENRGFLSEKRGFLPKQPPLLRLPAAYEPWEAVANRLPELMRELRVRQAIDRLPMLPADPEHLPDRYLLRAASMMVHLAHSYHWMNQHATEKIADCILQPWQVISQRLGRQGLAGTQIDFFNYNWRLLDPEAGDVRRVENLQPAFTVFDETERIFAMTLVEAEAVLAPVIGAVIRAGEAILRDDPDALRTELLRIYDALKTVTFETLNKISANDSSDYFVDPCVWGRSYATLVLRVPGEIGSGTSGAASPSVHLLDSFFGRRSFQSLIGSEVLNLRKWYPVHWLQMLAAADNIVLKQYLDHVADPLLTELYCDTLRLYAGDQGFLQRHAMKAYGYLNLSFKVGRHSTLAGQFLGGMQKHEWDDSYDALSAAIDERWREMPKSVHYARLLQSDDSNNNGIRQVVLDVREANVRYEPGDRCAIFPENSEELIAKTLKALRATGDEEIPLSRAWREALTLRDGFQGATRLRLYDLLRFGRIRPVDRPVAKALYAASHNYRLKGIINARAEDQWELWDMLELIAAGGYDTMALWRYAEGQPEHICRTVRPEDPRLYSIASVMLDPASRRAQRICLRVGELSYQTTSDDTKPASQRYGTASRYLSQNHATGRVALQIVHPPRFRLPNEPSVPIVMFAGGSGIAPFRGFIEARAKQTAPGAAWLFLSLHNRHEFSDQGDLEAWAADAQLNLRVVFTQENLRVTLSPDHGGARCRFESAERRHIQEEMEQPEIQRLLVNLLRSRADGGQGAYFYVCGRAGFGAAVTEGLKRCIAQPELPEAVRPKLYRLVGEGRYLQDIFTTYTGTHSDAPRLIDASEVVQHCDETHGLWQIIDARVYDLTEFSRMHAGGFSIIRGYAGMDATQAFRKVRHHLNPEIVSLLAMYDIGAVRRLNFGRKWSVVVGAEGLECVTLDAFYRSWIRALYNVVEYDNALNNMCRFKLRDASTPPGGRSLYEINELMRFMDSFVKHDLVMVLQGNLGPLWAMAQGFFDHSAWVNWMSKELEASHSSGHAQTARSKIAGILQVTTDTALAATPAESETKAALWAACQDLEAEIKRLMADLKHQLCAGLVTFETWESDTLPQGGAALIAALRACPVTVDAFYRRVASSHLHLLLGESDIIQMQYR